MALNDLCESAILEIYHVFHATLALKAERDLRAVDLYMSVTHCCQTVRMVGTGIFLVPNSYSSGLHQADDRGQDFGLRKARLDDIPIHMFADRRQSSAEGGHPLIFSFVADFAPTGMISTLLSATGIPASGLQVAGRVWADPYVFPCRRYHQSTDSPNRVGIAKGFAVNPKISKRSAGPSPGEARLTVGDITQPCLLCGFLWICRRF